MDKIKFSIENVELVKEVSEEQIALLKVFVCHDGNNSHNFPISLDTIKTSAENSLRGKPILYEYLEENSDFGSHSPDQIPAGYFIENQEFEYVEREGKTFLVAICAMWKKYANKAYEIFVSDNKRPVSMEIEVIKWGELNRIAEMAFQGVTILGESVRAACAGSEVSVVKFSEEVEKTEKICKEFNIQTDVNLESNDAIKEVGQEEFSICGELDTQAVVESDKEGEGMKSVKTEFEAVEVAEDVKSEEEMAVKEDVECVKEDVECAEVESAEKVECVDMPESETEDGEKEEEGESESEVTVVCEEKVAKADFEKMEQDFTAKIEALETELETLRQFKATVEKQEYDAQVDFAIDAVRTDLTSEQVDEWREKSKEFSSIDTFTNSLKAFAYDVRVAKTPTEKEEFSRMEVVTETITKTQSKSIWA